MLQPRTCLQALPCTQPCSVLRHSWIGPEDWEQLKVSCGLELVQYLDGHLLLPWFSHLWLWKHYWRCLAILYWTWYNDRLMVLSDLWSYWYVLHLCHTFELSNSCCRQYKLESTHSSTSNCFVFLGILLHITSLADRPKDPTSMVRNHGIITLGIWFLISAFGFPWLSPPSLWYLYSIS